MKTGLWCPLMFWCLSCFGQTNWLAARSLPYSLPPAGLRAWPIAQPGPTADPGETTGPLDTRLAERQDWLSDVASVRTPSRPKDEFSLGSDGRDWDTYSRLDIYRRLSEGGYLTRPAQPSENKLVRFTNSWFQPEVFHIGRRATFSCSLLTAIKHKNPLCLLNVTFLQLSW
jgi:hypothetical protein